MSFSTSIQNTRSDADFEKQSATIATSIQKILQNVSTMQRMVNQIGTAQHSPDHKQQLQQLRTYTDKLVKDTESKLTEVLNSSNDRSVKIQKDRLVDEFGSAISAFQNVQKKSVEIEKNQLRQARSNTITISKPPTAQNNNSNKSSFLMDTFVTPTSGKLQDNGQMQTQLQDDINIQAMEDQERTIRELEESIVGVNEIYKNLGALVFEQGHIIDSIESSVEQTSVFVSEGTEQLHKASQYKNKLRKKKLILALIAAAVLLIIFYMIYSS